MGRFSKIIDGTYLSVPSSTEKVSSPKVNTKKPLTSSTSHSKKIEGKK